MATAPRAPITGCGTRRAALVAGAHLYYGGVAVARCSPDRL